MKIDQMQYTFGVSYGRLLDRIAGYRVELGLAGHTISRALISTMVYEEYGDAMRGGLYL